MVFYNCEICNYETSKKSDYDTHVKTKKHLKKLNETTDLQSICCSSPNTFSEKSYDTTDTKETYNKTINLEFKIRELELIIKSKDDVIKMKDEAIEMKDNIIKMKDDAIRMKDEIISLLQREQKEQRETPKIQDIVQYVSDNSTRYEPNLEPTLEKSTHNSKKEKTKRLTPNDLDIHFKNAVTIEECSKLLKDDTYNEYIENYDDMILIDIEHCKSSNYNENSIDNSIDVLTKFFKNIGQLPFYCTDKWRNTIYIKTENGWIKETEENKNMFDEKLFKLMETSVLVIQSAICNTQQLFKDKKTQFKSNYGLTYDAWIQDNLCEIIRALPLICDGTTYSKSDFKRLAIKKLKIKMSELSEQI